MFENLFPPLSVGNAGNRDIGFLEIDNDPAVPRLSVNCLCPNPPPIMPDPLKPEHRPTCVVGFPVDEIAVRPPGHKVKIVTSNFSTHPVAVTEEFYQYVYPLVVGRQQDGHDRVHERALNTPHGYSGGGVWVINEPPSEGLTLPHHLLRLYAIQSSWGPTYRVVNCVPIRHWLRLVYDRYPDLQELLADQFPFLREG